MGDICTVTATQQAASDAAAAKALDASKAAGTTSKLEAMASHTQAVMNGITAQPQYPPVPWNVKKKHDVINYFLGKGLNKLQIVEAMSKEGFKIKPYDVVANKKWYGTEKIPANFPKAGTVPTIAPTPTVPKPVTKPIITPPTPKPIEPVPTSVQSDDEKFIMHKQVGPQTGSNPGGLYEDANGTKRYVKLYAEAGQGMGEKVSNEIYRRLGLTAPESELFKRANGQLGFASKIIENEGTVEQLGLTKDRAEKILEGFAADVLTANWDAVGLGLDNVVVLKGGGIARIDQGGSLLYRAKGKLKDLSTLKGFVSEWEKFAPGGNNPAYAKVFNAAGISKAEDLGQKLIKQIDDIKKFRASLPPGEAGWAQFITGLGVPAQEASKLASVLEQRYKMLIKKAESVQHAVELAEKVKALMTQSEAQGVVFLKDVPTNTPVPPNLINVQGPYATSQILVSKPPQEIIDKGAEAIAKWYAKYVPALDTPNYIANAIGKLGKASLQANNIKIETWMVEAHTGKPFPAVAAPLPGYKDADAAARALDTAHKGLADRLSSSTIDALRSYGGAGYGAINQALRLQQTLTSGNVATRIRALDNVMKTQKLGINTVLYRGLGGNHKLEQMTLLELQKSVGLEFTELAYGSTTTRLDTARAFSAGTKVLRFHASADTHGVWMRSAHAGVSSEYEFLMARGAKFRITGVSLDAPSQIIYVDMELIEQNVAGTVVRLEAGLAPEIVPSEQAVSNAMTASLKEQEIAKLDTATKEKVVADKFYKGNQTKLHQKFVDSLGTTETYQEWLNKQYAKATLGQTNVGLAATTSTIEQPPFYLKKKHDLINYYLHKGLKGQQVVDAMAQKGFKIKVADVNANIKWYGTEKIPTIHPKAGTVAAGEKFGIQGPTQLAKADVTSTTAATFEQKVDAVENKVGWAKVQQMSNGPGYETWIDAEYAKLTSEKEALQQKLSTHTSLTLEQKEDILFEATGSPEEYATAFKEQWKAEAKSMGVSYKQWIEEQYDSHTEMDL